MLPRVLKAKSRGNYQLEIVFDNQETKVFDVSPYLEHGIFNELRNTSYFDSVAVEDGTVSWKNGQDFGPDTLYLEGKAIASAESLIVRENPPEKYGE